MDNTPLTYSLTRQNIDLISEFIATCCEDTKVEKQQALKCRLSAEECLLRWLEFFEQEEVGTTVEEHPVQVTYHRKITGREVVIQVAGTNYDPYGKLSREYYGSYGNQLLVEMGLAPDYAYHDGVNELTFHLKKKPHGMMTTLAAVVVASLLVGFAGNYFIPAETLTFFIDAVLTPVYDTFFRVLSCVAGPMVFFSVAWGVYSIGDPVTLGRIGKRMLTSFLGVTLLVTACGAPLVFLYVHTFGGTSSGASQFSSIFELLLSIFPSNIVEPFSEGNSLQIIFLAFVIGCALLFLGRQTSSVAKVAEEINYLVQFLMEIIGKLVPFFIFIILANIIWTDTLNVVLSVWHPILIFLVAYLLVTAVFLIVVGMRFKTAPALLLRKNLPAFLIALTTASSAAAFGTSKTICDKKLGIDDSLSSFGIPLGMIMFKPATGLYFLIISFYFAGEYQVNCSASWLVIAVIVSAIVAVATPPVPGGAAAAYTILFTQIGLPSEAVAIALAIDLLMDFVLTSGDTLLRQLILIPVSSKAGLLDEDLLRKP